MGRIHAFEISDQDWCPALLREVGMTFLRYVAVHVGHAERIRPVLERALQRSGETAIFDLCSGGGGPILPIAEALARAGRPIDVTLTDIRPIAEIGPAAEEPGGVFHCEPRAIDARAVPPGVSGLRTIINAFHHFRPDDAQRILASAVEADAAIAVVEVAQRRLLTALAILGTPIHVLCVVPSLRPFHAAWIPLTYLVPIVPLAIGWDAFVSCLRCYSRMELLALANSADPHGRFDWTVEEPPLLGPLKAIALIGIPKARLM